MAALRMFTATDLNKEFDWDQMSLIEKDALMDEIFNRQWQLGEKISCEIIKRLFLLEINRLQHHYKDEIIFNLKGKMSFKEVQEIILSFVSVEKK